MGTLLNCHNFSNMPLPLAVPLGPAFASRWVSWSCAPSVCLDGLRLDLLLQWEVLPSPSPWLHLLQLSNWLDGTLAWKIEAKWSLSPSTFSTSWVTRSPISFWRVQIFHSFPFTTESPMKAFLIALMPLVWFNSTRASAFLAWFLTSLTICPSLYSSQGTCPCFHPP